MHTPHKLFSIKCHAQNQKSSTNMHPMLYAHNCYLLLFYRCKARKATKKLTACQRQKMSRKKHAAVVRNSGTHSVMQKCTQLCKEFRKHEPSATRTFCQVQMFIRKMRCANRISTNCLGVIFASHAACHFVFNLMV